MASSRQRSALRLAWVGAALLVTRVPQLQAQDAGPIVINPQVELRPFVLLDLDVALELEWRRNVDELESRDEPGRRDTEDRYRAFLEIGGNAFVGHPNLLDIKFNGWFGPQQRDFSSNMVLSTDGTDEFLVNVDVAGTFFREQKLPVTLYAISADSTIDRRFGSSLDATFIEWGGRAQWRGSRMPTNLQIFRREQKQTDTALDDEFRIDQDTVQLDGRVEMSETSRLWWDYTYDDISQTSGVRVSRSFERQEANVNHTLDFGDEERDQLRSRFRFYEETGDLDIHQLLLNERLRLEHSADLTTWYDLNLERLERLELEQDIVDFQANLRHQLFDSLTTLVQGGASRLEISTENFRDDELFARLTLDYNKRVPLGQLLAGVDVGWDRSDRSDRGQPVPVFDTSVMFNPGDLAAISGRNIIEASVLVTDQTGTITYTEGIDYNVQVLPDRVVIQRIPGGSIPPGDTVIVDYVLGPVPGGTTDTNSWGLSAQYRFTEGPLTGLQLYTRYRDSNEDRSPFTTEFVPNDFTNLVYGLQYDVGRLHLLAEHEDQRSSLSPFDKDRLEARWVERLGSAGTVILSGFYQEISRPRSFGGSLETTTLAAQWRQRFSTRLTTNLNIQWRHEDATFSGTTEAFEQHLIVGWNYQQTSVYAEFRNVEVQSDANDTSFQTITIGLRREF